MSNIESGGADVPESHEQFEYLCALEAAGQTSSEESASLREHLQVCAECRAALSEYTVCADVLAERSETYATIPVPQGMYGRFRARAFSHGIQLPHELDIDSKPSATRTWFPRLGWMESTPRRFAVAIVLLFLVVSAVFVFRKAERQKEARALQSAEADKRALASRIATLENENNAARARELKAQTDVQGLAKELSRERHLGAELDEIRNFMRNPDTRVAWLRGVNDRRPGAFGFVLYVPGKRLVLFAHDLTDQDKLSTHSPYAWGSTGTNARPKALGKLNLESQKDDRWALRINAPDILASISRLFVTIEPNESKPLTPTGRPVLTIPLNTAKP